MNNASFHLSATSPTAAAVSARHPFLTLPNHPGHHSSPVTRLLSADSMNYGFAPTSASIMNSPPTSQMLPLNFSQRDLLQFGHNTGAFQYINGFQGLPMLPANPFGIFSPYHSFFSKSSGLSASAPNFMGAFMGTKDDDLQWQKRSPSNLPDSPLSGQRSSPNDTSGRKRLCVRSKSAADQNVCPICGQTVPMFTLQEHFLEEMKSYRLETGKGDRQASSPDGSSTSRHARSSPATPTEIDTRHEVYARVRNNRRQRVAGPSQQSKSSANITPEPRHRPKNRPLISMPVFPVHRFESEEHARNSRAESVVTVDVDAGDDKPNTSCSGSSSGSYLREVLSPDSGKRKQSFGDADEDLERFPRHPLRTESCSKCNVGAEALVNNYEGPKQSRELVGFPSGINRSLRLLQKVSVSSDEMTPKSDDSFPISALYQPYSCDHLYCDQCSTAVKSKDSPCSSCVLYVC